MNNIKLLFLVLLGSLHFIGCGPGINNEDESRNASGRLVENFGEDWQFQRVEGAGTANWETVSIPHTTRIEPLVVNDQWQGKAVYKKTIDVSSLNDKKWFLHFESVMQEARVYLNDSLVKTHKGGYLPFTIDATDHLKGNTSNIIKVEVLNVNDTTIPPGKILRDLDFNLYGGIYRNVHLIKTNKIYITDAVHADKVNSGGVLLHFDSVTKQKASGILKAHIKNDMDASSNLQVKITFLDKNGNKTGFTSSEKQLEAGKSISISEEINIEEPHLWSPKEPNLYEVQIDVFADGDLVDSKKIKPGIRKIELQEDAFLINGEKLFINGTNRHQEYPYVGYALSDEAQYRDAYKIKEAGFNFVRLSHYPHATAFLEACDELGLLVMNAIPGWQFFEKGEFVENAIQDIKDMARRDRNHPSVVFWENSLNESGMTDEFMERANQVLKAELPYGDIFTAGWIDHPSYDLFIPARQHAKPPKYWNDYNKPNRPILIAEYGDWEYYAQNAGFNQKAFSDLKESERSSRQLRGAGEKGLLQQALNYQEAFNSNLRGEQTIGHSNWLMFDYNRGYSDDLEASGISDIFRIPKFAYYFYKSQKAPGTDEFSEPMVFIANYWTKNSTKNIKVFSNTEEVALYLNDELIERKTPERNEISDELPFPPFVFDVNKFTSGELKAVGYIDGKEVATHSVETPGKAAKIELSVDFSGKRPASNTPDLVFIYARLLDENGNLVPTANNPVNFSLRGDNAELIGKENFTEAGIATILLRTESFSNALKIRAFSEGLEDDELIIE